MKLLLPGTAGQAGWPVDGCPCASCARLPQGRRRPFELVVDDVARFPFTGERAFGDGLGLVGAGGEAVLCLPPDREPPADGPARYDVVVLDLLDRPHRLGELRRAGLADDRTTVVAAWLDHRIRSEDELARRLRLWGAVAVPDGTVLESGRASGRAVRERPPRRALLLGGSRSGKSAEAELRLAAEPYVTYVATGGDGAADGEWAARVRAHRERRPVHWDTAETTDLAAVIGAASTPLLIDGLGTWLAAVFDEHGAWDGDRAPVGRRCAELVAAWRGTPVPLVAVSDEVGMGVVPATSAGRAFRDALGKLNEQLAAESEYVALVVAGRPLEL
ncbi:bifunctional adenosylcobinamide kinase/adenosylcobinamide-phosphate guanylyltransferase [Nonomuraea sp. NPDC052265]|uniref:bifunctional adenosylcobinamide kinase/adenosylcobinamide-phosphate guanylyltransferase n=1 Tax=Nonomuraea sp. NPDC052265 TaxID=3364374 RepID=UPI0037C60079